MNKENLKLEYMPVGELKGAKYNPRKMDELTLRHVKKSIEKFDLVDPLIVNSNPKRKNIIIGGHARLMIAKELGYKEVPVVFVNIPTEAEEKELNLRLNKNVGEFDLEMLAEFDKDMLEDVGFDSEEIDKIFDEDVKEDGFDLEEALGMIKIPRTKLGDIYELGEHRLICGDSTKSETYKEVLGDELINMIFTDPPYNVDYKSPAGESYNSTKFGGSGGKIFNDKKSDEECLQFYTDILKCLHQFSTDKVTIYWWFANKNNWLNRLAFMHSGWKMSQIIIWLKNSMVFSRGQDYHRMHEPCMLGWKEGKSHYRNKTIADLKDVFNLEHQDFLEMLDVWYQHRDPTNKYIHPTQRPIRLPERAIRKNSKIHDIICDAFGGSGSTMMASEQLGRRCRSIELDPKFCDAMVERWCQFSKDRKVKLNNKEIEWTPFSQG